LQEEVSWGDLLSEGRSELSGGLYTPVVLTSVAIVASIAAFYLLSNGIRRRYGLDRT
jgi:ABC-type dipeptide/oligopeptide/nickel transport system permease subunit